MVRQLLPGLLVAACGLGLAAGLRRLGEPLRWGVAVALLALVLLLLHPVLLFGGVLLPADALLGYAPFAGSGLAPPARHGNFLQHDLLALIAPALARVRADLAAGGWPLWNPYAGAGIGLLSDPQAQAGQPLVLLALLLPVTAAMGVVAALRVLVALLFTFLLLRRQGVGEAAALAGALAWGLSGYLLLWLGWPLASTGCWLPALLWASARLVARSGREDAALVVASTASLALAGHPETLLYALALAALVVVALVRAAPPGRRRGLALRWLVAVALGLAATLPVLLPGSRAAAESQRAAGLRARATAAAVAGAPVTEEAPLVEPPLVEPPLVERPLVERPLVERPLVEPPSPRRWLPVVAPNAFGNSRFLHYWGPENSNEDASGFAGTATLLLALLGLLARRGERFALERPLQAAVLAALLLMALPAPLRALADRLPLALQSTTYYHRLLLVVGFGLACLAAFALDRLGRSERRARGLVTMAVALATLVAWAYLAHAHPGDPERLAVLREGWLRWQLRFLALTAGLLALLPLAAAAQRRAAAAVNASPRQRAAAACGRVLPLLVAAAIAAELLLAHAPANPAAPPHLALPASPLLARLGEVAGDGRTLGVGRSLPPNVPTLYGLADPRQYNPVQPAAYAPLAAALAELRPADLAGDGATARLVTLLGVRAVLLAATEERTGALAAAAATPPAPAVAAPTASAAVEHRPTALPLLWLPRATERWTGGAGRSLAWATASPDPRALSYVEAPGDERPLPTAADAGPLRFRWTGTTRITAWLATPPREPRLLATSVGQDGGWRALAGGARLATTRANGPFLAAWLPAGARRVELLYRPPGWLAGASLAALAAAAALAWLAAPPRSRGAAGRDATSRALTPLRGGRYSASSLPGVPSK